MTGAWQIEGATTTTVQRMGGTAMATLRPAEERDVARIPRTWDEIAQALAGPLPGRSAEICVIRHGQTTLNALGLVSGGNDTELTRIGRIQAVEAAKELSRRGEAFDVAYSSHLERSRQTLAIVRTVAGWDHIEVHADPRLGERRLGALEARPARRIPALERGDLQWSPPGGESYAAVARRLLDFLVDLLSCEAVAYRRVLLCSHVGPMRLLLGIANNEADPAKVLGYDLPNLAPVCLTGAAVRIAPFLSGVSGH